MKKTLCVMLVLVGMLLFGTSLAEEQSFIGLITEVTAEGDIICQSTEGPTNRVKVDVSTERNLERDLTQGSLVRVEYSQVSDDGEMPEVTANAIYNHTYEGEIIDVDTSRNRILMREFAFGDVWVTLPGGLDLDALRGEVVRVHPQAKGDASFQQEVEASSLEVVSQLVDGVVSEIGNGYIVMDFGGRMIRVNITATTKIMSMYAAGSTASVIYRGEVNGDQVTALSIWVSNG